MLPPEKYVPFDHSNAEHINHIIHTRWRNYRPIIIISYIVGLVTLIYIPLFIAAYILISISHAIAISKRFSALYADKKRGEKLVIPFHPYPYCIPEVGRYYIQTNIDFYPYITIDKDTYYWMDTNQVLYMEVAPKSNIIFDISAEEAPEVGETHPMLKTPSQVRDRKRWN